MTQGLRDEYGVTAGKSERNRLLTYT